ncbi:MAG: Hsp20/alpha crystallin family protein [Candidatus Doudnabacteria bacterium]|nr:Hsp20/alpha crystallin family protein [Candidatus Doudnabacteria bacterium]
MTHLVRWTPFRELDRWFEDDFFSPMTRMFSPAVNLYETDNEVVAEVSIPGIDPKKVNVEIENNVLHIRGEETVEQEDKGKDYFRKEIRSGMFARSLQLPEEVEADKISATSEKGILKIIMPKSEKAKPKKVAIEVKE